MTKQCIGAQSNACSAKRFAGQTFREHLFDRTGVRATGRGIPTHGSGFSTSIQYLDSVPRFSTEKLKSKNEIGFSTPIQYEGGN